MPPHPSPFLINHQNQQTPPMSPPHSYTDPLNAFLPMDGEDDDICPICDGDCTCNSSSQNKTISAPVHATARPAPSSSSSAPLKIKLTVPPSLISRALPSSSKKASSSSSATAADAPKRRGRPPKPKHTPSATPAPYQSINQKKPKPAPRAKDTTGSTARRTKTKPRRASDDEYCPTGQAPSAPVPSYVDSSVDGNDSLDRDVDMDIAMSFPTFMSALSSTSTSSSSSDSSSSEDEDTFQSDSSIVGEEEQFILAEEQQRRHDRARVHRELMGDAGSSRRRSGHHHTHTNNWEIRPRKNSGDEMDMDMDADSEDGDSSQDEEETEDEEDNDEADVEGGGPGVGVTTGDETGEDDVEGEEGLVRRVTYHDIATGWSEDDEESSMDAELFFAGLTDSSSSDRECVDDEQDEDTVSEGEAHQGPRRGVSFEVTEGWDGSVIFTNGLGDGQGLLEFDFDTAIDAHAQFFMAAPSSSDSSSDEDEDLTAPIPGHEYIKMEFDDADAEETGYERDCGESEAEDEMDSDDGATTDEELVDADGLPTERLMRLFRPLPILPELNTVSAIDPMSTMSPGSPTGHHRSGSDAHLPRPADILAGHMFWDSQYDHDGVTDEDGGPPVRDVAGLTLRGSSEEQEKSNVVVKKERGASGPRMGTFEAGGGDTLRRAVIAGGGALSGQIAEVPSPFPRRCGRKRRREEDDVGSGRSVTRSRTRSVSMPVSHSHQPSLALSPTPFLPSDDPTTPCRDTRAPSTSHQDSPEPEPEPVLLSDVLDPSLLDSDPFDIPSTDPPSIPLPSSSTGIEDESVSDHGRHLQSLSRWDRIPMGTFRRTRESGDGNDMLLDGMLRSSPFSGMLWSAKGTASPDQSTVASPTAAPGKKGKNKGKGKNGRRGESHMDVIISPVILPVRDRDGDRTPTHAFEQYNAPVKGNGNKGRGKESRRDKMMKRKSLMGISPGGSSGKHHHRHQHHPNTKGRALNGVQRAGGYGGAVPPLSL